MIRALLTTMTLLLTVAPGPVGAQGAENPVVGCADLRWSARLLAANPDIADSCYGVYEKDGTLYARSRIEVLRVRGSRIAFRPLHTDGSKGASRSISVPPDWRATIAGRQYRVSDLVRGQELDVFIPEDRFAIAVDDGDELEPEDLLPIEEGAAAGP